ncbi:MAG: hydantoinase/oxoprolinase family protein [Planctomycetes bacterium]|nr:hydantoinase/oxoprolinase family protein [Planctomycetota bacterium]
MIRLLVGIDVGGTFTDFVVLDKNRVRILKLQTAPEDIIGTIKEGLKICGVRSAEINHGTTLATNTLLERKGSNTAVITTAGFEDIIEIGRQVRNKLYEINVRKIKPLVPSNLRFGVRERVDPGGKLIERPDINKIRSIRNIFMAKGDIESIAIIFVNSYMNGKHEDIVKKYFKDQGWYVCVSHEVSPQIREYERFSTTVINAYVGPKIVSYLNKLRENLANSVVSIMSSTGGNLEIKDVISRPVETILSGPAAGVIAAKKFSETNKFADLITFDMGGTSTDVSVIHNHEFSLTKNALFDGLPIQIPQIEILSVGQGGGSVIYLDEAGILRVGPKSQGAFPGPACYNNGGKLPTITDAYIIKGILRPEFVFFKQIKADLSYGAFRDLTARLRQSEQVISENAIKIASFNMSMAVRRVSIEKGLDPRDFYLLCFGGAGPLHCCDLIEFMGLKGVIIPLYPGNFCALGALLSDKVLEHVRTVMLSCNNSFQKQFQKHISSIRISKKANIKIFCEMKYKGQSYELMVPYKSSLGQTRKLYDSMHKRIYGFQKEDEVLIVNVIVREIRKNPVKFPVRVGQKEKPYKNYQFIHNGRTEKKCMFVSRSLVRKKSVFYGPLVLYEDGATTFVKESFKLVVDKYGNLIVTKI